MKRIISGCRTIAQCDFAVLGTVYAICRRCGHFAIAQHEKNTKQNKTTTNYAVCASDNYPSAVSENNEYIKQTNDQRELLL